VNISALTLNAVPVVLETRDAVDVAEGRRNDASGATRFKE